MTLTIRQRLEASRDDSKWIIDTYWTAGGRSLLVQRAQAIYDHAVAALQALDEAERASTWLNGENVEDLRLVPDPAPPTSSSPAATTTTKGTK